MIKILNDKDKNFDVVLNKLLSQRKIKVVSNTSLVTKIINDVKKKWR